MVNGLALFLLTATLANAALVPLAIHILRQKDKQIVPSRGLLFDTIDGLLHYLVHDPLGFGDEMAAFSKTRFTRYQRLSHALKSQQYIPELAFTPLSLVDSQERRSFRQQVLRKLPDNVGLYTASWYLDDIHQYEQDYLQRCRNALKDQPSVSRKIEMFSTALSRFFRGNRDYISERLVREMMVGWDVPRNQKSEEDSVGYADLMQSDVDPSPRPTPSKPVKPPPKPTPNNDGKQPSSGDHDDEVKVKETWARDSQNKGKWGSIWPIIIVVVGIVSLVSIFIAVMASSGKNKPPVIPELPSYQDVVASSPSKFTEHRVKN